MSKEISQILSQGPALLASQQNLAPGYTNLNLRSTSDYLNGTPGQMGALDIYGQRVLPSITAANDAANTTARTALNNDLTNLGPGMTAGIQALNPSQTNIYNTLATQAQQGLAAGNQMTPAQLAQLNNSIRSSQGARGMSYGPAASYSEVMANSAYGDQLQQQRQQAAGAVADMGNRYYTLPGIQALTGTSGASGQAQSFFGSGANTTQGTGNTFNELGGYASDLFNTNYNGQAAANISGANAQNGMWGNIAGLGGALGSAAITGAFASSAAAPAAGAGLTGLLALL